MKKLLSEIKKCTLCEPHLDLGAKPIVSIKKNSKILLISQAPGRIAHEKGIPWEDPGGNNLRKWLGVSSEEFYNQNNFAILPMGFCYPGKGKSGDKPPRKECAPLWHEAVLNQINKPKLTILIGGYAQKYYLKEKAKRTLTETVDNYPAYLPEYFVLPHPSPRNRFWLSKNPWFEQSVIPELQQLITSIIK
jgi:uracil-DNA glycosylase family 4